MLHISLAAETLWMIGGFPITNSLLTTWIVMAVITFMAYMTSQSLSIVPSRGQSVMEVLVGGLHDFFESVVGHSVKEIFPLVASLFIFIIVSNWSGLIPGVGTIGFYESAGPHGTEARKIEVVKDVHATESVAAEAVQDEHATETVAAESAEHGAVAETVATHEAKKFVPLFRAPTADLNTTLALALVAVIAMQYFGFRHLGGKYSTRFVNFSNPIMFYVGILEIVSDISKVISFAFRLFGNIFAGEVLLAVMAFLMPFLAPLPFLALELFVGFIQALVFSTLTASFINVAVSHEEH